MRGRRQIGGVVLGAGALALFLASTGRLNAAFVAYSNFGPGNGGLDYNTSNGWFVGGRSGENDAVGERFTPSQAGTLSQITLALEFEKQGTNEGTVSLRADNGRVPGAILESWSVSNLPTEDASFHTPISVTDAINEPLLAGTTYWVVVSTGASNGLSWHTNNIDAHASHATSTDGGASWSTDFTVQGAFQVTENPLETAAAPEPASLTLLATGALGLLGYGWRKRRQPRAAA